MTDPTRESEIEKYLVACVGANGGEVRKLKWIGRRNAPDRFIALNGRVVIAEVKRPGKRPTAAQEREIQRLLDVGCTVTWVSSHEEVDLLIDWMMAK